MSSLCKSNPLQYLIGFPYFYSHLSTVQNNKNSPEGCANKYCRTKIIPSISLKEDFLNIKVDLPPVGLYCKGCDDGISKGLFTKSPKTGELILARARSITGGYDTPAGGKNGVIHIMPLKSTI